ncbi:MAG TPA: MupA/Atu3671 family FMN-dependent luciferase-like monooxygenase, partial [Pyrinomonadaceae bacterium]
ASFIIPEPLCASLNALSQRHGVTLFMTLLAGLQVLLSRYTGEEDVSVGTVIAGRNRAETENIIGPFINTLVMRTDLSGGPSFGELLQRVKKTYLGAHGHQEMPFEKLVDELAPERDLSRSPLFQVMFILQNVPREAGPQLPGLSLSAVETSGVVSRFDLSLSVTEAGGRLNTLVEYNTDLFDESTIDRMMRHYRRVLEELAGNPEQSIASFSLLGEEERRRVLFEWNDTARAYPRDASIHGLFEEQVERTPGAVALAFEGEQMTYRELNGRANRLARHLRRLGARADTAVGVCMGRSAEMMVALLAILKAGAAYVPLDPKYPADRLSMMLEDAGIGLLLTGRGVAVDLPAGRARVVSLDAERESVAAYDDANLGLAVPPDSLAYVIYTSGSTGRPKGVMVPHRQVLNFFTGMDERLREEGAGVWLAVTSISFDISVLELFWTLTRGYKVVIQGEQPEMLYGGGPPRRRQDKGMEFSLFYFASDGNKADKADKYRLLIEGAKFADRNGFAAVWTPERHFHAFGDLYPNPAVTGAAIATITERVQIRAGSVVLPLHHPVRVAEEWAMVDNLSHGRVGLSFASGWHAADFVFAPANYAERRRLMAEQVETVRRLWRGEALPFPGGTGQDVEVRILPQPLQKELPFWLTSGGTPDTFRLAGTMGANLLTHLLGQTVEELSEKIAIYRRAWREAGHEGEGAVSLMLHTFVGEDLDEVRESVREPFTNYLASSLDLMKNLGQTLGMRVEAGGFSDDDMQVIMEHAFERYFGTSGLMGTPEMCLSMVERLKEAGVDEVACLIDFGVEYGAVLEGLRLLNQVKELSNRPPDGRDAEYSFAAQVERHGVTHLQCTPSMASMLGAEPEAVSSLGGLRKLLLGGEALPPALVRELDGAVGGEIHNMYGPTETTIWSASHLVEGAGHSIPIGRPLANTQVYILDRRLGPQPPGVFGEIYIGGEGVVRGYLRRAGLTAERFIPDPYGGVPGARLYRTGDVGRFLPDGSIEFGGRTDEQVKLRGHRIELGEIESVLRTHPDVREAVVVAREDEPGHKRLAAYLIAEREPAPAAGELRSHLRRHLPEYMIPSAFVVLEALPLTPNGKLNRRALPEPERADVRGEDRFVAPRTPTEELMAEIWSQVLGVERVGVNDNFFELGGNSLLATRLIHDVRRAFSINLPLRSVFDDPTVAGLALSVEEVLLREIEELAEGDAEPPAE